MPDLGSGHRRGHCADPQGACTLDPPGVWTHPASSRLLLGNLGVKTLGSETLIFCPASAGTRAHKPFNYRLPDPKDPGSDLYNFHFRSQTTEGKQSSAKGVRSQQLTFASRFLELRLVERGAWHAHCPSSRLVAAIMSRLTRTALSTRGRVKSDFLSISIGVQ